MKDFLLSAPMLLVIYGVLVLLASLAGGWLLLAMRLTHTRLQTAVSFVAGLMLGMAMLHFIPHSFHHNQSIEQTVEWVLGGFLIMFFLQRFLPYHHHDIGGPEEQEHFHEGDLHNDHAIAPEPGAAGSTETWQRARGVSWVATTLGMSLHSVVGGIALGAAMMSDQGGTRVLGLGTALAIVLHKPFDAMAIATLMAAGGCSRFSRHMINALFACVTPAGMVLFYLGASQLAENNPAVLGIALAFSAGTFLCIAAADLLPELQFHSHDRIKLSVALIGGILIAVLIGAGHSEEGHEQEHPAAHLEAPH